jgi:hypothetical protein
MEEEETLDTTENSCLKSPERRRGQCQSSSIFGFLPHPMNFEIALYVLWKIMKFQILNQIV